jgi:hypothetical protein
MYGICCRLVRIVNRAVSVFDRARTGNQAAYTDFPGREPMLYTLLVILVIVVLAIIIWRAVAGRTV